jgi:hypothetical protein
MTKMSETISADIQLHVILDCLSAHQGQAPQLNASSTKSIRNFHFIREERSPSCSLFTRGGDPFVHDFGTGQTYNYISVYAEVYGVNTSVAFQEILKKYLQNQDFEREAKIYTAPKNQPKKSNSSRREASPEIQVSPRFKDFELEYFNAYGIHAKLLRQYEVYALRGYKKLQSKPGNPVFAFKISEECYKIYQPLTKNKAYKWFWVGEKPQEFLTYGLAQLPEQGSLLFLTEGLKDALSIRANTPFEALALDSASNLPPKELIQSLKTRFQKVIVCFDADTTGRKQAEKLAKEFGLYSTPPIPPFNKVGRRGGGKDVSDFFRLGARLEDFRALPIVSYQSPKISIQKYLTEAKAQSELFGHFRAKGDLLLPAPTGSGKNEVVNRFIQDELSKNPEARFFNGFPNNISAEAKTKEYSNAENNFSKIALDIGLLDQYTSPEERKFMGSFPVVNFVYNSFSQIETLVGEEDYLFLDEYHKWITQGEIAPLAQIQNILNSKARKVFLSGTPFESFAKEFGVQALEIEQKEKSSVQIQLIELYHKNKRSFNQAGKNELYNVAAAQVIENIPSKESKLHLLYLNDREALERLAKVAREKGLEAEVIYSEEEIKKNSEAWQCLVEAKPIPLPKNCGKILLMTSLVYDSLNLNNPAEEIGTFAIFGEVFTENVRQALHRPRKAQNLKVLYFLASHKEKEDFTQSYTQHRNKWKEDYEILSKRLQSYSHIELLRMSETEKQQILHDVSKVLTDDLQFNRLACVIDYEQKKARRETNLQKKTTLEKYYPVSFQSKCITELGTATDSENKLQENNTQLKKLESAASVSELMRENLHFTLAYLYQTRLDAQLKGKIKDYLGRAFDFNDLEYLQFKTKIALDRAGQRALRHYANRFLNWVQHFGNEAAVLDIVFSKKYPGIARQFKVAQLLAKSSLTLSEEINQKYYLEIIAAFKIGESYTKSEREVQIKHIYQELQHTEYAEAVRQKLFKALFLYREDRSDKSQRKLQILEVVNLEALCEIYGIRKIASLFPDKNKVLNKENKPFETEFFVGEGVGEECPF